MTTRSPRPVMAALLSTAVIAILVLSGGGAYWHHQGGRWFVVTSPSMGEAAPTGSLLLTRPTTVADVHDGDLITFHSPTSGTVFSHRVVGRTAAGLTTRGDVNLVDDAWTITDDELIGEVTWHRPVLGWVLRAAPLLALGLALTWLITLLVRTVHRYSLRLIGASVTVAVVGWVLHPWVGLMQLSQTTPDDGSRGALMEIISTGLLPARAYETDGTASVRLHNGEVGTLHLTHPDGSRYDVAAHLDLHWWGWVVVVLLVFAPLLWTLVRGLPPVPAEDEDEPEGTTEAGVPVSVEALLAGAR